MSCGVTESVPEQKHRNSPGAGSARGAAPGEAAAATIVAAPADTTVAAPKGLRTGSAAGNGNGGGGNCRLRGSITSSSIALASKGNGSGLQPSGTGGSGPLRPKPCCLCWCCCCSCSCSTPGKGKDENGAARNSNNSDPLSCDGDPSPSLEELRSWGRSFDKLMRNAVGRKVFRDFLRCEYSEENILFWLACEDLKLETNPEAIQEKAKLIYEDYISILSPKEVSLDAAVREIVNRNMVDPTPHAFDEAQVQIYTLMHRDSYPRFVNSPIYKTLAKIEQQPPQSEKIPTRA